MRENEILPALQPVVDALERNSVAYYIGGSIASSIYGMARATMDIDIVAGIELHHVALLKQSLEDLYYIDEDSIVEAIQNKSSFNLIHLQSAIKKVKDTLDYENIAREYYFASPEDIILSKLQWYELGGKVSERQWLDVIGVIKVQGGALDASYLQEWAERLGLIGLLFEAFNDAGIAL